MPVLKRLGFLSDMKRFFLFLIKKDEEENKTKQNDFIPYCHPV